MILFEVGYLALLAVISLFGLHRAWLAFEAHLRDREDGVEPTPTETPPALANARILIQLPVYNDGAVLLRLLDSIAALDLERERAEVQVLDDSDDGSSVAIAARVARLSAAGWRVEHLRREDRTGYKAGALAAGLLRSDAPFVAIFDSDFVVPPDFFRALVPEFRDPGLAYVQARWGFANAEENRLTRVQALMLDAHFRIEHRVRSRAGRFFNFNGTAGIWRRAAIDDAGGWRSTSITEDLDLSLRAWVRGWRMRLRDDVVVPSDLPTTIAAYRTQQNRWVSGSVQTFRGMLEAITSSSLPWGHRVDALLAGTGNLIYPLILVLLLALPHAIAIRLVERDRLLLHADIPFFLCATLSVGLFYWCARDRGASPGRVLGRIVLLMALGLGMTVHNTRAVLRGLTGRARVFERTPKTAGVVEDPPGPREGTVSPAAGRQTRRSGPDPLPWLEGALLLYLTTIGIYAPEVALFSLPLIGLLGPGTAWLLVGGMRERRGARRGSAAR